MKVAVFAKQIPNADDFALDPDTLRLRRSGASVLDDSDTFSVEMGLQLAGSVDAGEVTLISMTPEKDTSGLRTALAMGAASALVITDELLAGADALTTAKVLAAAVRHVGADLVLAATESSDGYTGTVPVQVAELLGWPSVSFARKVEIQNNQLRVQRQTESGWMDVECSLPAVVSVTAGVVTPRYPSFKGIMSAKSKPINVLGLSELGIDAEALRAASDREKMLAVAPAPARQKGELVTDDGTAHERIVAYLVEQKLV